MVAPRSQSRRVNDRYDLRQPLGRGGMGVVWLAEDTVLQRDIAVKEVEFPPGVPADEVESLRARVLREARSAGRLNHPNVTTIYDVVVDEGSTWIVMEYVDAPTLTDLVTADGPLPPARAASIGLGLLSALEAAHAAGIVHRDVKPGNVMVPATGHVKLADFGVAAVQGDTKLTMTGLIIGSPSYMAPEQAQEGVTTAASDMWGLGATLYYAVEGEPPFDKGAAIPTLSAVTYEPPRPMERAGALAPVLERLLAKDPEDRPTAGELESLLREVAGGDTESAGSTAVVADDPAPATAVLDQPQPAYDDYADEGYEDNGHRDDGWGASGEYTRRRRSAWPWVLVAGLLLVAALVLLPGLLGDDGAPEPDVANEQQEQPADDEQAAGEEQQQQDEQSADQDTGNDQQAQAGADVPEDWTAYEVGGTGSTVAYPADWSQQSRSSTATDLVDPEGGRYLRVDYTEDPGDDAVADWENQSDSFAQSHANYEEIAITEYDYPGAETAGLWEYSYEEGGAQLHAYNLAIVTGGRGYALNFQTREDQWDESQELWEQFVAGFEPAP